MFYTPVKKINLVYSYLRKTASAVGPRGTLGSGSVGFGFFPVVAAFRLGGGGSRSGE
jgi:hypothetical protein